MVGFVGIIQVNIYHWMGWAGLLTIGLHVQAQDLIGLSNHFDVLERERYTINTMHFVLFKSSSLLYNRFNCIIMIFAPPPDMCI